ncbi:unnamed protein product, partial [marine sediment metagenome]
MESIFTHLHWISSKDFGDNIPVDYFEKVRDVKSGEITMS